MDHFARGRLCALVASALIAGCAEREFPAATDAPQPVWPPSGPVVLAAISPATGPVHGGARVVLTGAGFQTGAAVRFGPNAAERVVVESPARLICDTPVGPAGPIAVTVTTPDGQVATLAAAYVYSTAITVTAIAPATADAAGGTTLTLSGTNFTPGMTVRVGSAPASNLIVRGPTELTAEVPAGPPGPATVLVADWTGTTVTAPVPFAYTSGAALPTVWAVSPGATPGTGGAVLTIAGNGFGVAPAVTIGGVPAPVLSVLPGAAVQVVSPRPPLPLPGPWPVVVTTAAGASAASGTAVTADPVPLDAGPDVISTTRLALDPAGVLHRVSIGGPAWGSAQLRYTRSMDRGPTWSVPVVIPANPWSTPPPIVAARGGVVAIAWVGAGYAGALPLMLAESGDGGASFAPPRLVATAASPEPALAVTAAGEVLLAWSGLGGLNGSGWPYTHAYCHRGAPGAPLATPVTLLSGAIEARGLALAADGGGRVLLAVSVRPVPATGYSAGYYALRTLASPDGGVTWGAPQPVGQASITDFTRPTIALGRGGAVLAYRRDFYWPGLGGGQVEIRTSVDGGTNWGPAVAPAHFISNTGGYSATPIAATDGAGTCVIAWTDGQEIREMRTCDLGTTWTSSTIVSGTPGPSYDPMVAGGGGHIVHAWWDGATPFGPYRVLLR